MKKLKKLKKLICNASYTVLQKFEKILYHLKIISFACLPFARNLINFEKEKSGMHRVLLTDIYK